MVRIARDITWLIGRTPLVDLSRLASEGVRLLGKLEAFNPTSSNKDRAALCMIEHAERSGFLRPGGTIIECTAGDLGVSLAMVAARRGYRLVLTMPAAMAETRDKLLRALGAQIVTTDPRLGMRGAMERAEQLARENPDALVLQPFANRANTQAHRTTAREIWEDTDGTVDVVVCPVGTGGTASGCIAFFRETRPEVRIVGVEPARSPALSGGPAGAHDLPGLGAGFVPEILCPTDLAEVVAVEERAAFATVREVAAREAILLGPASGAVLHAARTLAHRSEPRGTTTTIVAILPDSGERYEDHAAYEAAAEAHADGAGRAPAPSAAGGRPAPARER